MERILVVNVNWLGDAILTTPIFKALKDKFPSSYVGVMIPDRLKGVFEDNLYIDELIVFNERTKEKSFFAKIKFIKKLRTKRFDTAILIHRSFTRAFICMLAGIKKRAGYRRIKTLFVLTKKIPPPKRLIHRQDYYLYLLEKLGIPIKEREPYVFVNEEKRAWAFNLLKEHSEDSSFLVAFNPSANWLLKQWPAEYFAKLGDKLIEELDCAVILIGAKRDCKIVSSVEKIMRNNVLNLCGKTSLKELAAILEKVNLLISSDSGPAHLASALEVNVIALFGPTSAQITSPRGRKVRVIQKDVGCKIPCYQLNCKDNICMKKITPEEVFFETKSILLTQ